MSADRFSSSSGRIFRLPPGLAFLALAFVPFTFFVAASAPSPTFVLLQRTWGFSSSLLTLAFAVYALALLAALLVTGSLSDHVGRRPVLWGALVLEAGAMLLFLTSTGIGGLVLARIVQGLATGLASGAMTAAVVEIAPPAHKRLGALIGSVSPLAGLACGALLTGVAIRYSSQPVRLVFGTLAALFLAGIVVMAFIPESVTSRAGGWASLVPKVAVPKRARLEFQRGLPVLVSVWALGSLYLSLVPSLLLHVFDIDSGLLNGIAIAVLNGVGAVVPTLLGRCTRRALAVGGTAAIAGGSLVLSSALYAHSVVLLLAATVLAGAGFGCGFAAIVQMLAPLAEAHERAKLFAAIFVVSYLAFSLPALAAGVSLRFYGLFDTAAGYTLALTCVATAGTMVQWRARRTERR